MSNRSGSRVSGAVSLAAKAGAKARRIQLVVLAATVAGFVAIAGMVPLVTDSIGRAMVDHRVDQLGAQGRSIEARVVGAKRRVTTEELAPVVGDHWNGLTSEVVGEYRVGLRPFPDDNLTEVTLIAREKSCQNVRIVAGTCPTDRFGVAISQKSADALGLKPGDEYRVSNTARRRAEVRRPLVVRGVFDQPEGGDYWRGRDVEDVTARIEDGSRTETHTWLTNERSFAGRLPQERVWGEPGPKERLTAPSSIGWGGVETSVDRAIAPGAFTYDRLADARSALDETRTRQNRFATDVQLVEQVSSVDEVVGDDLEQLRVIGPLLLAQLLVLQAVLTWIVARALLTQRRREVALIRLRSTGRSGAARVFRQELVPPILIGLPIGFAGAYALDWLIRSVWLSGTAGGWTWLALAAAGGAAALCLIVMWALTHRLVRTPIGELLRGIAPRSNRWRLSIPEVIMLTVAVGLLATVVTGTLSGAPVLVTPIAMALAAGLVLGGLIVPLGNRAASRLLQKGRVSQLLGMTSLARRPSTRNIVLALTAAGAMVTFAVGALQLGELNRHNAAAAELGAPVRLTATDITGVARPTEFVKAIDRLDPQHEVMAPVLRMRSGSSDGPVMLAADPAAMSRISLRAGSEDPWSKLPSKATDEATLPAVVTEWSPPVDGEKAFAAPSLAFADSDYVTVATVPFIPGAEQRTFITSLRPLLESSEPNVSITPEVWATSSDPALVKKAKSAILEAGYSAVDEERASATKNELDQSASAYGLQLGVVVALGALLVASFVLLAVLSSQASGRARDHQALRLVHVPASVLSNAGRRELLLVTAPILVGAMLGWVGVLLAAPGVPWFSEAPPYDVAKRVPPVLAPLLAGLGAAAVTVLVGVIGMRWAIRNGREAS